MTAELWLRLWQFLEMKQEAQSIRQISRYFPGVTHKRLIQELTAWEGKHFRHYKSGKWSYS